MNNALVLSTFLNQLDECIADVASIYSTDGRFIKAQLTYAGLRKSNPRMIINTWKTEVADRYFDQINAGDVDFFLNREYSGEKGYQASMESTIQEILESLRVMSDANRKIFMKYLLNLTKLSKLYT